MGWISWLVIGGLISLYLATFWIKNDHFWGLMHKGVVWGTVTVFLLFVAAKCTQGILSRDDPIMERQYRR